MAEISGKEIFLDWVDDNLEQLVEVTIIDRARQIMAGLGFSQATIDAIKFHKTGRGEGEVVWDPKGESGQSIGLFIEEGTDPSPGRFVAALGKRLVDESLPGFGEHPGTPAQHPMAQAEAEGLPILSEVIIAKANEDFRRIENGGN